ncbi:D-alanyl-D-alanine carboxypeptidase family protein [Virgibacillus halodenitrificans]|uniref:D-alanyl-D-alanine carboxypeptidase family protein n=1 Tax=Virgibacillus halodenitrificans TaxID=1482 RepID=UPI000761AEB3|nr:D-alanyl-D-alanine carboxypeptidase family protein [Virgibacillus halodenitrificans]MCG1029834.1 D-alanyl-D-alanine carboxypeptidase [Virgibacillus halodenitrificans]MCJ0930950.1 D-alanyl-D-alanine carboxypeptidase [Virgibacillus halodenitrificans]MEC2160886.1 D-alanyl-D-alanine carboxypeptidase [Virgibacillus halodenitrificans]WHX27412.1 D-alanyl-D-alanine carboxypeptidase family protein [Virgibacillus halodenitrificans]
MKKKLLITSMMVIVYSLFGMSVYAEESKGDQTNSINLADNAKSAILLERDTGQVFYDKDAHVKLPPASMTKIMTLLLIMEALEQGDLKYEEKVRVSERAASMGGSQIFLEAGEEMTVKDLLKGIAVASGNDASVALAERIAGSEKAFVKKMNQKVKKLGLENTKFQNTTGLPAEDHYSTAYDMAMIAKELLKYEEITKYTSIYEDYLRKGKENEFWLVNTNKLVKFYPGVDGLKTGYTNEAKYCLTATAKKDDMRVIAVVMGAGTIKERNATISGMLDYAFNHYETKHIFDKGERITSLNLLKAERKNIEIITSESISTVHRKGEDTKNVETVITLDSEFTLPLKKGAKVGMLYVKDGDKTLSKTPLTVKEDIEKASYLTLFKRSVQKLANSR